MDYTYNDIAKMIDHSLLNPVMTDAVLEEGIQLALEYDVAGVCIKPYYVKRTAEMVKGSGLSVQCTIGFPHGGHVTSIKVAESIQAMDDGATELDMVCNIGKVLTGDYDFVKADIKAVVDAAHDRDAIVKVIFENCYLEDEHKIKLCEICAEVKADFVKTSTGYGTGGATDPDLKLMREHSPASVEVKAAGGVRTLDRALEVRALGVTRFGATATKVILDECKQRLGK